jgi:nitrous oxide reductase accessory protein NosL
MLNYMTKIKDFTLTYAQWAAAGFPRREEKWVKELFAICERCEFYDPNKPGPFGDKGSCQLCGCHVGSDHDNPRNKIVLPNTSCPDKPPKWEAVVEPKPKSGSKAYLRALVQQSKWRKGRK